MGTNTRGQDNGQELQQITTDLWQVYEAVVLTMPAASARWVWGFANDKDTTLALWKGYDAGVHLATVAIDSLYRSESLSGLMGATINQLMHVQRLSNAATRLLTGSVSTLRALPVADEEQTRPAPRAEIDASTHAPQLVDHSTAPSQPAAKRKVRTQKPVPSPLRAPVHDRRPLATA